VHQDLVAAQMSVSKNRVHRLMKENGIQAKTKKKFKVTTDSKHNFPIHNNILNREFSADKPNLRWVSDITYIPTREGWLYLAVIMDLFSRRIVGWAMDSRMKEDIVINALKMALFKRKINSNLLLHSDRGSQYAASAYQSLLVKYGIQCSMSRKGNCWDNSAMESFFHSLKIEHVHHERYTTREEAKNKIFEYIEVFYNRQRRHSAINYKSPNEFELMQAC
jgi:transposase InsO family protein